MIDGLATGLIWFALGVALWALVLVVINRRFALDRPYGQALAVAVLLLEVALLGQAIAGLIAMFTDDRAISRPTFAGYLLGPLLIVPLAAYWAAAERTRWGPAVLVVGCVTVPVMIFRLQQIWAGHG